MTTLAERLRRQPDERHLTQQQAAGFAGATLSDILSRDHLPRLEILFRIGDYFEVPRDYAVRLSTHAHSTTGPIPEANP